MLLWNSTVIALVINATIAFTRWARMTTKSDD
jgi:hypothetical protein